MMSDVESKSGSKALKAQSTEALTKYVSDTCDYIRRVRSFSLQSKAWRKSRKTEMAVMERILDQSNKHKYDEDLQELSTALDGTRRGLQLMEDFLDALEKLAVTSLHVFEKSSCDDLQSVCSIIQIAQSLCPSLLSFKRDNQAFFQPKLENTEVLYVQLEKYTEEIENICEVWKDESLYPSTFSNVVVERSQTKLDQINLLSKIRMDPDFRMGYLFQGREHDFTTTFTMNHSDMCDYLKELEGCAERLDNMNKGANISGVVSSSVGVAGGAITLTGILLAPFTLGLSLGVSAVGVGLGAASGVTDLVTDATELGVNETESKKVEEKVSKFIKDTDKIQSSLENIMEQHFQKLDHNLTKKIEDLGRKGATVCSDTRKTVKCVQRFRAFRAAKVAAGGVKTVSKTSKFIGAAGALFSIGEGIYSIVQHSKNLQNGCETEVSRWVRARVALWRCEINFWQRMCDSLKNAQRVSWYKDELNKDF